MFKRVLLVILLLSGARCTWAQTAALQGHSFLGGTQASTSGLQSTNYLNGIVPHATIAVYLTGTTTLATIYADGSGTPLSNPFTSNAVGSVNPGGYIFWAATNQGYDIVASGGISPNTYSQPVTLCADCYPGFSFTPASSITLQHNGANLPDQSRLNFSDDATLTPDSGYTLAKWLNNSTGALAAEYLSSFENLQDLITPPITGNYVIVYPTTYTPGSCSGVFGPVTTGARGSLSSSAVNSHVAIVQTCSGTWSGFSLPAGITPASVTAIYAFASSKGYSSAVGGAANTGQLSCTLNGTKNLFPPGTGYPNSWPQQTLYGSIGSAGDDVSGVTCGFSMTASETTMTYNFSVDQMGLMVYSTSAPAPTLGNTIYVVPPLKWNPQFQQLSITDNPSSNLFAIPISGLPPASLVSGQMELVNNGATATDCSTGGGSYIVNCYSNGTSYTGYSMSGAAVYPGAGIANSTGSAWGTSYGTNGSGTKVTLPSGTPASGDYTDGGTFAWTPLPFQSLTTTGTTGAATLSGGVLNVPNYSAGSSGVTSLNSLTGALDITGDSTITVTPSGSSIALHATGSGGSGVQYNPPNTKYFVYGTSQFIVAGPAGQPYASACANGGESQLAISAGTVTSGVGTFTYSSDIEPIAGNAITLTQFSTSSLNQNVIILSTGLTSTTFEANISGGFSGSTGTGIGSCTYNVPSQMQTEPFFDGHGSVYNYSQQNFLISQAVSDYTTWPTTATSLHALSPAQSGNSPEYLFVALGGQDLLNCATNVGPPTTPGTMEYEILQLFALAHADGYVVVASDVPDAAGTGAGCADFENRRWTFNQWLLTQSQGSNSTTGEYWDQFVPLASKLDDATDNTVYIAGNDIHLTESGAKRAAQQYNQALTTQAGLTSAEPTAQTFNSLNVINSLCMGQMGLYSYNPACPSTISYTGAAYEAANPSVGLTDQGTGSNVLLQARNFGGGAGLTNGAWLYTNLNSTTGPGPLTTWYPVTGGAAQILGWDWENCFQNSLTNYPGTDLCLSRDATTHFLDLGTGAIGSTAGGLQLTNLYGQATAPTGSCSPNGLWQFTQDGKISDCVSGTWTVFSGGSGTSAPALAGATYVAETGSTAVASITSPALTVTAGDIVVVACRSGGSPTSIAVTDSIGNTWTSGTFSSNTAILGTSWSILTTGGSDTFTCTPSAASGYQSMTVMDFSGGTGLTLNTTATYSYIPVSPYLASGNFTTTHRVFGVVCAGTTANPTWMSSGNIGGVPASRVATSAANFSTGGDVTCFDALVPPTEVSSQAFLNSPLSGGTTNPVMSVLLFNY